MIQNWLVTKVYKTKHDQCNFEFITKGMPIIGTSPNIPFSKWTMKISKYIEQSL